MKCLYCPDFIIPNPQIHGSLGYCSVDVNPGTINGLNETKCSKHPANRKLSDKVINNNQLGVVKG